MADERRMKTPVISDTVETLTDRGVILRNGISTSDNCNSLSRRVRMPSEFLRYSLDPNRRADRYEMLDPRWNLGSTIDDLRGHDFNKRIAEADLARVLS